VQLTSPTRQVKI